MGEGTKIKKSTSIYIDENLWREWLHFVINKYESSRKASEALEDAMKAYMERENK